jgi:hypothetical protein
MCAVSRCRCPWPRRLAAGRRQACQCCRAGRLRSSRELFVAVTVTAARGHSRLAFTCTCQVVPVLYQMKSALEEARYCQRHYPVLPGPGSGAGGTGRGPRWRGPQRRIEVAVVAGGSVPGMVAAAGGTRRGHVRGRAGAAAGDEPEPDPGEAEFDRPGRCEPDSAAQFAWA